MDALQIRIILNGILALGFLAGAISLFLQRTNGITKAMAFFTLFASFHVSMLIVYGFVDALDPSNLAAVQMARIIWNWISFGWILTGLYLAYVLVKGKDDE